MVKANIVWKNCLKLQLREQKVNNSNALEVLLFSGFRLGFRLNHILLFWNLTSEGGRNAHRYKYAGKTVDVQGLSIFKEYPV
ncbi:hypothetical protein FCM35_KLT09071 [Carex littledalei]|uniref:Uncharacterized protein n=1 Tax=Carex littledalei TaxID=544730 RepID=A0A833V5T7_9POAL|nr:hypothetical protein FCM35_KLT09071 [Carex littledalei]